MARKTTPADAIRLSMQMGTMLAEAQMVIAMRTFGMMGLWRVGRSENTQMVQEKVAAAQDAAMAAGKAMMAGANPTTIAGAALKPIARRTAANAKRLSRLGPGHPK